MRLEETKEKVKQHKRSFEHELKITNGIENRNNMTLIHDDQVNKIGECNLLHDIINPLKHTKILKIYYSPIIH